MKILNVISAIAVLLLASCSESPSPANCPSAEKSVVKGKVKQGKVNYNLLSRYEASLTNATYTRANFAEYIMDDLTNGKWELDDEEKIGGGISLPSSIVINNGKVYQDIKLFSCSTGPTRFATALNAVNKRTRHKYEVYAGRPFTIDDVSNTLAIDDTVFGIVSANDSYMTLSYEYEYWGGRTGNGGKMLEVGVYYLSQPLEFNIGDLKGFDTVTEAYDWLIEEFRNTFGDCVDLNTIYAPNVILTQPLFYLEWLEAERDSFK